MEWELCIPWERGKKEMRLGQFFQALSISPLPQEEHLLHLYQPTLLHFCMSKIGHKPWVKILTCVQMLSFFIPLWCILEVMYFLSPCTGSSVPHWGGCTQVGNGPNILPNPSNPTSCSAGLLFIENCQCVQHMVSFALSSQQPGFYGFLWHLSHAGDGTSWNRHRGLCEHYSRRALQQDVL